MKSFGSKIFPYTEVAVSTNFRKACKKLKINYLRFHDLRHEAISSLFELGFNVQHVMAISGHSDLAQLSRYTNTTPAEVIALASNLKRKKYNFFGFFEGYPCHPHLLFLNPLSILILRLTAYFYQNLRR